MKDIGYETSGSLLERAAYELMEREGWDPETQEFIDFDEDDNDSFLPRPKHTHNKKFIEESVKVKRKPEPEEDSLTSSQINPEEAVVASIGHIETTKEIQTVLSVKSNEQLYTYAFCDVFGEMPEVHYDQIDQLSLPFFNSKDNRAIQNKTNILIRNQCVIRKPSDKKWFILIPEGIKKFKSENQHMDEILNKNVSPDFLNALRP
jgi:hypothetical protein